MKKSVIAILCVCGCLLSGVLVIGLWGGIVLHGTFWGTESSSNIDDYLAVNPYVQSLRLDRNPYSGFTDVFPIDLKPYHADNDRYFYHCNWLGDVNYSLYLHLEDVTPNQMNEEQKRVLNLPGFQTIALPQGTLLINDKSLRSIAALMREDKVEYAHLCPIELVLLEPIHGELTYIEWYYWKGLDLPCDEEVKRFLEQLAPYCPDAPSLMDEILQKNR